MKDALHPLAAGAEGIVIRSRADIADALGACLGSNGLVLTENELGEAFFDLRSGLAGELFQKFSNYRLPVAIVLTDFDAHGQRFAELAREHAAHRQIRFVHSLEEAHQWLQSLAPGPATAP